MGSFLASYQGKFPSEYFSGIWTAYLFFVITMAINIHILRKGIVRGIETLAKFAMPILFFFAIILVIRVFTLGAPNPAHPDRSVLAGLNFMWNPDFSRLKDASCWLAAAGQIFFTLSIGFGAIQTYASYLKEKDDIALSGLSSCTLNEFSEVILGGSIAIPVAVAFFGVMETQNIANGGSFDLGFQAMPLIFQKLYMGHIFGFIWFALLFLAGVTSSVALSQPAVAFLQDEFRLPVRKAANIVGAVLFIGGSMVVFFLKFGFLDELDFWAGTFGLVAFAFIETVFFAWIFGMDKGWAEINKGADIKINKIFYYIIKYVTPVFLFVLLTTWFFQSGIDVLFMKGVAKENVPYLWLARGLMIALFVTGFILIKIAWKRHKAAGRLE
ncbi:sodium:calcium symporter [Candidatus Auribacterota bacterium]